MLRLCRWQGHSSMRLEIVQPLDEQELRCDLQKMVGNMQKKHLHLKQPPIFPNACFQIWLNK